jgi:hypothetical protein
MSHWLAPINLRSVCAHELHGELSIRRGETQSISNLSPDRLRNAPLTICLVYLTCPSRCTVGSASRIWSKSVTIASRTVLSVEVNRRGIFHGTPPALSLLMWPEVFYWRRSWIVLRPRAPQRPKQKRSLRDTALHRSMFSAN